MIRSFVPSDCIIHGTVTMSSMAEVAAQKKERSCLCQINSVKNLQAACVFSQISHLFKMNTFTKTFTQRLKDKPKCSMKTDNF